MVTFIIVVAIIVCLIVSWATLYVTKKAYSRKDE
jgi:hypothetical protein